MGLSSKLFVLVLLVGGTNAFVPPAGSTDRKLSINNNVSIVKPSLASVGSWNDEASIIGMPSASVEGGGKVGSRRSLSDVASSAGKVFKSLTTRTLKNIPAAAAAAIMISYPQSALAFSSATEIIASRKLIKTGAVLATAACGARLARLAIANNNKNDNNGSSGRSDLVRLKESAATTSGTSTIANCEKVKSSKPSKIPITILAGFLGAGKTTALKRLLENTEGIKVGTIVNDVAAVNIDAKLISNPLNGKKDKFSNEISNNELGGLMNPAVRKSGGTVELQNGCACCSLSDELLTSVSGLMEGRELDAIVIELSGVADPMAVKQNWEAAIRSKHPATELADVSRVVTVVDSHTFGSDWMSWDSAGKRKWSEEGDQCAAARQVPELLAEQVEAADVVVLNKIDLSEGEQLETAKLVVRSLNENAELVETKFGDITPTKIIGDVLKVSKEDHAHSNEYESSCSDPTCNDSSHSHSHAHAEESHSHHHSHDHSSPDASSSSCSDPSCSDESHSHSHSHDHESSSSCEDPSCTEDHSHSHSHASTTSTDNLGISNFVYKSSRPFDSKKLFKVLMKWPIPVMEELNLGQLSEEIENAEKEDGATKSPFVGVLRSKGFAWVAPSVLRGPLNDLDRHDTVMYWSHAGKHFGLKEAGTWWASMGKAAMRRVFEENNNIEEYERIIREDFVSGEWGDRRQEIVFIGANLDEEGIREALDGCLCTEEEVGEYKQALLDAIAEFYAANPQ